jgi:NAD dependent epimerase/dehydratase family enzyme
MHAKFGLPASKWMLEIGAFFMKTETELILKSRWVIPERLRKAGYSFKYDTLDKALRQILKESNM